MKVSVLGGGNGAYASAAHLRLKGHKVKLFSSYREELEPIIQNGGIDLKGSMGNTFVKGIEVFNAIDDAVEGSDIVMVVVPATAHTHYGEVLASVLKEGQLLFLNPGHTGGSLHMTHVLKKYGLSVKIVVVESNTLTYITRKTGYGEVTIYKLASSIIMSALPAIETASAFKKLNKLYPCLKPAKNVLETSLTNLNAVLHPPGMLLNAGMIERSRGDFYFYSEGTTPAVGSVMEGIDKERMDILKAAGLRSISFMDHFYNGGYTTRDAYESGSYYRIVKESPPNVKIRSPQDLRHRYLEEDISCGLVPMAELGSLFGIDTPLIDALIAVAGAINGKDYREEGLNINKLGLAGMRPEELQLYVNKGLVKR